MAAQRAEPETLHFVWQVPRSGFEWCERSAGRESLLDEDRPVWVSRADAAEKSWLVPRVPGELMEDSRPLRDETGLFLDFAGTEPTQAAVLRFADRHGWLGVERIVRMRARTFMVPPT